MFLVNIFKKWQDYLEKEAEKKMQFQIKTTINDRETYLHYYIYYATRIFEQTTCCGLFSKKLNITNIQLIESSGDLNESSHTYKISTLYKANSKITDKSLFYGLTNTHVSILNGLNEAMIKTQTDIQNMNSDIQEKQNQIAWLNQYEEVHRVRIYNLYNEIEKLSRHIDQKMAYLKRLDKILFYSKDAFCGRVICDAQDPFVTVTVRYKSH